MEKKIPNWIKIISVTLVVAFLGIGVPVIINEAYKSGTGYITLWTAADMLSYYGTALTAFLTVGVILVAIWQYRQPLVKKLNIGFTNGFVVMDNNRLGETVYCISVSNTGVRPVVVTNVYLNVGNKNLTINNVQYLQLPKVDFPFVLEQEKIFEIRLSCTTISDVLQSIVSRNAIKPTDKVKVYVTDSTGGTYSYNPKVSVQDMIDLRDN